MTADVELVAEPDLPTAEQDTAAEPELKPRRPHRRTRPLAELEPEGSVAVEPMPVSRLTPELPPPPQHLVAIAESRRGTVLHRLANTREGAVRNRDNMVLRARMNGNPAEAVRIGEQMTQVIEDLDGKIETLSGLGSRAAGAGAGTGSQLGG